VKGGLCQKLARRQPSSIGFSAIWLFAQPKATDPARRRLRKFFFGIACFWHPCDFAHPLTDPAWQACRPRFSPARYPGIRRTEAARFDAFADLNVVGNARPVRRLTRNVPTRDRTDMRPNARHEPRSGQTRHLWAIWQRLSILVARRMIVSSKTARGINTAIGPDRTWSCRMTTPEVRPHLPYRPARLSHRTRIPRCARLTAAHNGLRRSEAGNIETFRTDPAIAPDLDEPGPDHGNCAERRPLADRRAGADNGAGRTG